MIMRPGQSTCLLFLQARSLGTMALLDSRQRQWKWHLEGMGEQGEVDVLPAHGVEQGGGRMHGRRDQIPILGHQDDAALQQQSSQQGQQGRRWDMEQQTSEGNARIPGPVPAVWRDLKLDEVLVAAQTRWK